MPQVKICPVCREHRSPRDINCACGCALDGVDPVFVAEAPAAVPTTQGSDGAAAVGPEGPGTAGACDHYVRPGETTCVYCNEPVSGAAVASLEWEWGRQGIGASLFIGREPPAPADLAARLESRYRNVSRRHAELRFCGGRLTVTDLSSTNGTFVNEARIPPQQETELADGDRVRFAAHLTATVRKGAG